MSCGGYGHPKTGCAVMKRLLRSAPRIGARAKDTGHTGQGGIAVSFDLISLILQAGLIVKLVLLLLLAFSVTSLTIIVTKWWELRAADEDSEAFLEVYRREGFNQVHDAARHLDRSPLAVVFLATGDELQVARERNAPDRGRESFVTELQRSVAWSASAQARRLERAEKRVRLER